MTQADNTAQVRPGSTLKMRAAVEIFDDGREVCDLGTPSGRAIYRQRIETMWRRQGYRCRICRRPLARIEATFDHENGRGMGGSRRSDLIVDVDGKPINAAVCWSCNMTKGSRRGYDR